MTWAVAAIAGSQLVSSFIGADAAGNAANAYTNAANQGMQYNQQMYNDIKNQAQPYQTLGATGANAYNTNINNGYFTAQPTMNDLTQLMPNYAFGLKQSMGQFNAGINAAGGAVSGNAIQGGTQLATDYAGTQLQNAFNNYQTNRQNVASNLGAATGYGLNANQTVANAGIGAASNTSNLLSSIGNAQAAGIMGQANAYTSGLNNISNYAMLYGMKNGMFGGSGTA